MPEDDEVLDPAAPAPAQVPAAPLPAPATPPAAPAPTPAPAPVAAKPTRSTEEATAADIRKRERSKALRELYGTDDLDEIERIKEKRRIEAEELQNLKTKEEQTKRDQMTEVQRLTDDVQRLTTENDQLKAKIKTLEVERVTNQQDAKIRSLAIKHIKPSKLKYAIIDFGEYIRSLTKADAAKMDELRTENWFKKFARENPDMSLETAAPAPAKPEAKPESEPEKEAKPGTPPAVQRPTRVVPAGKPKPAAPVAPTQQPPDPLAGKTPRPGMPNSMNKQELSLHMKRQGLRPL